MHLPMLCTRMCDGRERTRKRKGKGEGGGKDISHGTEKREKGAKSDVSRRAEKGERGKERVKIVKTHIQAKAVEPERMLSCMA